MDGIKTLGLCLCVVVIALCTPVYAASAAPTVSIEPASVEVLPEENFTVNITVDPQDFEIMGAQYYLYFDKTRLNATVQVSGEFLKQDGASTINLKNEVNNTAGIIEYGEMRTGVEDGITSSGVLASITFQALEPGVCDLGLYDVILSNPDAEEIPDILIENGSCVIKTDETPTPTSTTSPSDGATTATPTPTSTQSPTHTPTSTPMTTATTDNVSPTPSFSEPDVTATAPRETTPVQTQEETPMQTGRFTFTTIAGLLSVAYIILKRKR